MLFGRERARISQCDSDGNSGKWGLRWMPGTFGVEREEKEENKLPPCYQSRSLVSSLVWIQDRFFFVVSKLTYLTVRESISMTVANFLAPAWGFPVHSIVSTCLPAFNPVLLKTTA
jgi:hypothetical protein